MSAEILRLGLNPGPKPQALHPAPAPPRAQLCTRACSNKHTLQPSNVVGFFCFLVGLFCLSIKIFYIHSNFPSVAPRRRCQAPALRRARHPERGWGPEAPQAFPRGEHMGRVGFDPRSFFPWDGRSRVSHPTCDVPFPGKGESLRILERDDPSPPAVQGGQGIG